MAINYSENKVRVTKLFGGSEPLGLIDPAVGMQVKWGIQSMYIVGLNSGNYTVNLSLTNGGAVVQQAYPHDLFVESGVAGNWGWPDTSGTFYNHTQEHPNGFSGGNNRNFTIMDGDGTPDTSSR